MLRARSLRVSNMAGSSIHVPHLSTRTRGQANRPCGSRPEKLYRRSYVGVATALEPEAAKSLPHRIIREVIYFVALPGVGSAAGRVLARGPAALPRRRMLRDLRRNAAAVHRTAALHDLPG